MSGAPSASDPPPRAWTAAAAHTSPPAKPPSPKPPSPKPPSAQPRWPLPPLPETPNLERETTPPCQQAPRAGRRASRAVPPWPSSHGDMPRRGVVAGQPPV
eukprot:scaffold8184_cov36-Phaeocystis_antarctica.AAC.1